MKICCKTKHNLVVKPECNLQPPFNYKDQLNGLNSIGYTFITEMECQTVRLIECGFLSAQLISYSISMAAIKI